MDQKLVDRFLKKGYFIGYYTAVPSEMFGKLGQSKYFDQPNAEIGLKMANG